MEAISLSGLVCHTEDMTFIYFFLDVLHPEYIRTKVFFILYVLSRSRSLFSFLERSKLFAGSRNKWVLKRAGNFNQTHKEEQIKQNSIRPSSARTSWVSEQTCFRGHGTIEMEFWALSHDLSDSAHEPATALQVCSTRGQRSHFKKASLLITPRWYLVWF